MASGAGAAKVWRVRSPPCATTPPGSRPAGRVEAARGLRSGPLRGTVADDGAATLRYTYDKGRTTYRAVGSFRSGDGRLTGEVDFLAPNGVQIGHGVFRLAPAQATGRTPADPPPPDAGRTGKARQPVPGKAPGGE